MKTKNKMKRKNKININNIPKMKKEAIACMVMGFILFVGFLLFFIFFYRPFVPWKKIECTREYRPYITENAGTYIYDWAVSEVTYYYEINGVKYKKVFDASTVPNNNLPSNANNVPYIIYVNMNDPTDVKQGSRGGGVVIFICSAFVIVGGYFIGASIYQFHRIKKFMTKKQ